MPSVGRIEVRNHYKCSDFDIEIGAASKEKPFRHLILTGPNGSGKTTILSRLAQNVGADVMNGDGGRPRASAAGHAELQKKGLPHLPMVVKRQFEANLERQRRILKDFGVDVHWAPETPRPGELISAFLPARRMFQVEKPTAIEKIQPGPTDPTHSVARSFLKYLVNLEVQARLAKDDDPVAAAAIAAWLGRLQAGFAQVFDIPGLELKFVRQEYDIRFVEPSGVEYDFNHMADGHASAINIFSEILSRVPGGGLDTTGTLGFADFPGVVIIDELETHLHPAMQERILPFLVESFPRMQFIVATHSPAVICSVDDAWVLDLRSRQGLVSNELRGTPYGELMKIHFGIETDIDLESTRQLRRLMELRDVANRDDEQEAEFKRLADGLRKTSQPLALEVWTQLEQARLSHVGE